MSGTDIADGHRADRLDPIPDFDLADPWRTDRPDLDVLFARLRSDGHAVFWHGPKSRPGFWAVIAHAETLQVYRNSATFTATHGMTLDTLQAERDPASGLMLEVTDPPEHRRLRRSVSTLFGDGIVNELTPVITDYVGTTLADLQDSEDTDFVESVASRIPTYSAGLLLGLPRDDLDWVASQTAVVFLSDAGCREGPLREDAQRANNELLAYFAKWFRASIRAGEPRARLVDHLATATANGNSLTAGEAVLNALNLAIGGMTTTRALLSNLAHVLATNRHIFRAIRDDPDVVPAAVEEAVRWANPVHHLTRVATADAFLGGRSIRAGDAVVVWPRSANRDESVFPQPEVFDVRRSPNQHIGFAAGAHSCPGAPLARAQLRATLQAIAVNFTDLGLAGTPELMKSNFLHGYSRLPVHLHRVAHETKAKRTNS